MNTQQLKDFILNKKFTRLYVDSVTLIDNRLIALCTCECGTTLKVKASSLKSGRKKSCGCLLKEHQANFLANRSRGKQPAHTKPSGEAVMNYVYKNYKANALKRKLTFNLTKENFKNLNKNNCHYCDLIPSTTANDPRLNGSYTYNGIDRKDSGRGYELDNVVTCCENCNKFKSDLVSYQEFLEIIKLLKLCRGPVIW